MFIETCFRQIQENFDVKKVGLVGPVVVLRIYLSHYAAFPSIMSWHVLAQWNNFGPWRIHSKLEVVWLVLEDVNLEGGKSRSSERVDNRLLQASVVVVVGWLGERTALVASRF